MGSRDRFKEGVRCPFHSYWRGWPNLCRRLCSVDVPWRTWRNIFKRVVLQEVDLAPTVKPRGLIMPGQLTILESRNEMTTLSITTFTGTDRAISPDASFFGHSD